VSLAPGFHRLDILSNWTNGCIAMENDHLVELLGAFEPGDRPFLDIRP